jgi:ATP-dependent Lon protease
MPRKKTAPISEPVETPARRRRRVVKRRVDIPRTLPILPVRDNVYFPNTLAPVLVGREKSLRAVEAALEMHNKLMLLVTQRDVTIEEPTLEDLFEVGVVAEILQAIHAPDNTMRVVFRGVQRARLATLQNRTSRTCWHGWSQSPRARRN